MVPRVWALVMLSHVRSPYSSNLWQEIVESALELGVEELQSPRPSPDLTNGQIPESLSRSVKVLPKSKGGLTEC